MLLGLGVEVPEGTVFAVVEPERAGNPWRCCAVGCCGSPSSCWS
ncbi:hypothetical protein ACFQ0M_43540 [Kitasatospora aburaviensis]